MLPKIRQHSWTTTKSCTWQHKSDIVHNRNNIANPTKENEIMKGIILAGGSGTRLYPLTMVTSKQLLPIYDKPMIYYPMSVLMNAGIPWYPDHFHSTGYPTFQGASWWRSSVRRISYLRCTAKPDGLAQAFIIGEEFIGNDTVAMVLGDNIFAGHGLKKRLKAAVENASSGKGATVFGYYVDDPERFGIVEFDQEARPFPSKKSRSIRRATIV